MQMKLLEARQEGLTVGTRAVTQVVYKMATDKDKTLEERMQEIIKFCSIGLTKKEKAS